MPRGASHEVLGSCSTYRRGSPPATRCRRSGRAQRPGVASPGAFRPQGFDPLDGLRLPSPADHVSGRSAHGVPHPSELSPRPEPWRLSTPVAFLPFATHSRVVRSLHRRSMERCWCGPANRRGRAWLQGLAPRSESVAVAAGVAAADPLAALLGFGSLQGIPSPTVRPVLPPGILPRAFEQRSSHASACAAASLSRHPGSPESSRGRDWPRLTAQQALLGFSTSSTPSHD